MKDITFRKDGSVKLTPTARKKIKEASELTGYTFQKVLDAAIVIGVVKLAVAMKNGGER
jgi:hypothetical protein